IQVRISATPPSCSLAGLGRLAPRGRARARSRRVPENDQKSGLLAKAHKLEAGAAQSGDETSSGLEFRIKAARLRVEALGEELPGPDLLRVRDRHGVDVGLGTVRLVPAPGAAEGGVRRSPRRGRRSRRPPARPPRPPPPPG